MQNATGPTAHRLDSRVYTVVVSTIAVHVDCIVAQGRGLGTSGLNAQTS